MKYSVCRFDEAPKLPITFNGKIMFTSDRFEVVHLALKPGEGMELHAMPVEIVFFVKEGRGTLCFEGEELRAAAGDCIRVEPGVKRGWKNNGTLELKIIVMKLLKS